MHQSIVLRVAAYVAIACLTVITTGAIATDPARILPDDEVRSGRLSIRALDADSGQPLPMRARLEPRGLLAGPGNIGVARSGNIDWELAAGEYELFVTHGPEWSIVQRRIFVHAGKTTAIAARLRREVTAAAFTACDLHVHSEESPDGDLALADRVSTLSAEDVQFAVITDHNHVTDAGALLSAAGIGSLPGLEVTSWAPEFGHFNVFPRTSAPRFKHSNSARLIAELRRDPRAFVQINHPRLEDHIGYFAIEEQAGFSAGHARHLMFDALEVWNGYDLTRAERRDRVFRDWLSIVARGKRLVATGGSDSHHMRAPHVGYPRTYVRVPRTEATNGERVLHALKHGHSFVSSGPILDLSVLGVGPGHSARVVDGQVSVEVRVDGPSWMDLTRVELWLGRERVVSADVPPRTEGQPRVLSFQIAVHEQRSLVAVVRGERGMDALLERSSALPYAFTNPVWLEPSE